MELKDLLNRRAVIHQEITLLANKIRALQGSADEIGLWIKELSKKEEEKKNALVKRTEKSKKRGRPNKDIDKNEGEPPNEK